VSVQLRSLRGTWCRCLLPDRGKAGSVPGDLNSGNMLKSKYKILRVWPGVTSELVEGTFEFGAEVLEFHSVVRGKCGTSLSKT
jgi:hypothetical protein